MPTDAVTSILATTAKPSLRGSSESAPAAKRGETLPQHGQPVPPSTEQVQHSVQQIQKFLTESQRSLEFHVDEASGIAVVMVRDASTGDVIRQIPNEETVKLAQILKATGSVTNALLDLKV